MRRLVARSLIAPLLTLAVPLGLAAQSPVTVTAELGVRTDYLFAGIPFAAEEVTQATVTVGAGSFTINGFSVFDHAQSRVTEFDLYGDYYFQASETVGLFAGAGLYTFWLGEWMSTPEVYGGVVLATALTPTLYVAHDFDLGDGTHATLMLSHPVALGEDLTLNLMGNLDYNDGYYTAISGLSYGSLGAEMDIAAGPFTLKPLFVIQVGIDDTFTNEEVFGISASYTF